MHCAPALLTGAVFFLSFTPSAHSQVRTVLGTVVDAETREPLIGAFVSDSTRTRSATTDSRGTFRLAVPDESVSITVSRIGYATLTVPLHADTLLVTLNPIVLSAGEIVVMGRRSDGVPSPDIISLVPRQLERLPALLGEIDMIKSLALMPGVQVGSEGSAALVVRGGSPDQNLVLIDGAPAYNVAHVFGFFSMLNPDAVGSVDLYKGGIPLRYGGRLSSAITADMRTGDLEEYHVRGGVGLLSSRLTIGGPVVKDRASFLVAARRSYLDLLLRPFDNNAETSTRFAFVDANAKLSFLVTPSHRISVTYFESADDYGIEHQETLSDGLGDRSESVAEALNWRNRIVALRATNMLGADAVLSFSSSYSLYRLETNLSKETSSEQTGRIRSDMQYQSAVYDYRAAVTIDHAASNLHVLSAGAEMTVQGYVPGAIRYRISGEAPLDRSITPDEQVVVWGGAVFAGDRLRIGRLTSEIGVRVSTHFPPGARFMGIEPRATVAYELPFEAIASLALGVHRQYVHLLAPSSVGLPTDLWLPATKNVGPESSLNISAGVARAGKTIVWQFGTFWKRMAGLIEYTEGGSFFGIDRDWEDFVEIGRGSAFGIEATLQKTTGRLVGLVGYTFSRTFRRFDGIDRGRRFPYQYDRPHDLSAMLALELAAGHSLSMHWTFRSGHAVTVPEAWYYHEGAVYFYQSRNNYRVPAYHRLDISYRHDFHLREVHLAVTLGVHNVYSRLNPFYVYVDEAQVMDPTTGSLALKPEVKQVSLFPILPAASLNFAF